jgi:hypothetical protein
MIGQVSLAECFKELASTYMWCATYRLIDVSNDRTADDKECCALKGRQDPEDEEGCQIRSQRCPYTERSEQHSAYYGNLHRIISFCGVARVHFIHVDQVSFSQGVHIFFRRCSRMVHRSRARYP